MRLEKVKKRELLPPSVSLDLAREIVKKVREAKRPVINAGNGIRIGKAFDVFQRVVEMLGIPVVTGWNSLDCMYDSHPLYVGRAGHMGDRPGNFAVQNCDLLLSLGSRLSIRQVGYNYPTWAREAYVIYNDIDAEELKKPTVHVDMPVHADVKDLLEKMEMVLEVEAVSADGGPKDKEAVDWWISRCQQWKEKYPVVLPKHYEAGEDQPANIYAAIKEISRRAEEDQITVVGNGSPCVVGGHAYEMKKGQRFISNSAIASMGYDLPAAIGACLADHTKDIILVTGDGSIQMNLQELQTIIHNHLPIKIFLINNGGYHSIRQTQKTHFHEPLVGIGVDSGDLSFPVHGEAGLGIRLSIRGRPSQFPAGRGCGTDSGHRRSCDLRDLCGYGAEFLNPRLLPRCCRTEPWSPCLWRIWPLPSGRGAGRKHDHSHDQAPVKPH